MLKITDKYWLKADENQFIIGTKVKKGFLSRWFFSEPEHAIRKVVNLAVADGINTGSFEAIKSKIDRVKEDVDFVRGVFGG